MLVFSQFHWFWPILAKNPQNRPLFLSDTKKTRFLVGVFLPKNIDFHDFPAPPPGKNRKMAQKSTFWLILGYFGCFLAIFIDFGLFSVITILFIAYIRLYRPIGLFWPIESLFLLKKTTGNQLYFMQNYQLLMIFDQKIALFSYYSVVFFVYLRKMSKLPLYI